MDYNASGIDVYRLYCNKIGDMQYILQEHTLSQPEGSTIEKASHSVTLYMTEYFKKHRASSVYLQVWDLMWTGFQMNSPKY